MTSRSIHEGIVGRLILRSLVEALITFKYLVHKKDPALWKTYRTFGAGQAKLALLKAEEVAGELPGFISLEVLDSIANEDIWQEFLNIDLGQWAKSNLREMSSECGAKDIYDKYYGWTSSFVHAHWGAVRDSNFITCHNPLHRLHRIPRALHRNLESVEDDVVLLVNQMIGLLDTVYAGESPLPKITLEG